IDLNCDVDNYKIFPLLLQPLVENSVIHGIEVEEANSFVHIVVYKTDENLVIKVIDNGVGISVTKLGQIRSELNRMDDQYSTTSGIGLHNVNKRIKLYYGINYGIDMQSKVGKGTI